jgi:PAS domain S-box-containing protein
VHRDTDYALRVFAAAREVYRLGDSGGFDDQFLGSTSVPALGAAWQVDVWPRVAPRGRGVAADSALILGLMMAGLLGWVVQLGQRSARSAGVLASLNSSLQSEIVERTAAQTARAESEKRYRQIFDAAADIIYRTDVEGNFTLVNPAASRIMKWSSDELVGRHYLTLIRPDFQAAARDFYLKQVTEGIPSTYFDFPAITADGQEVWIGQHVQLITEHGRLVGCQAVARDISAPIRTQQELQRMLDAALETARFKSEFVANTSHEIRTPLNGILGFSNLLIDTELDEEQRRYADGLRLSTDSLLVIVNDILDFSKIEAGMLRLEILSFDLRSIVDSTIVVFTEAARRKGVALELRVADDVPHWVKGDPGRFRQVLTNLISNAIKFTDGGSVTISVSADTQTESHDVVRVGVRDTGIGIDTGAQGRLFQAFVQADGSTTRRFGGTGLGLAISRQLVDLMGGTISLESAPGEGSTFSFTVTLEKDQQPPSPGSAAEPDLRGLSLLVVDDSSSMREELVSYGAALGLRADDAPDGRQALTRLREAAASGMPYDFALLSLAHPDMDGMTLARTIRTDPDIAAVRIVLVPVKGMRGQAMEAREVGIAAYLPRPVQLPELSQCLLSLTSHDANCAGERRPALITRHTLDEQRSHRAEFRVLVTDDNQVSQQVTKLLIEKLGYHVDTASNGLEAIEAAVRVPYGVILMDCQMPVMDGFAATAEIRRREQGGRRTPIVAFTAGVASRDREECRLAGMDDFLEKPVRNDELVEVLNRWCSRSGPPSPVAPVPEVSADIADDIGSANVLDALRDQLGPEVLIQLIERQITQADASVLIMERAISSDAIEEVQREAHRLKGSSLMLGLTRMGTLCAWLEQHAGQHTRAEREQVLRRLKALCADLRRWYETDHQPQPH